MRPTHGYRHNLVLVLLSLTTLVAAVSGHDGAHAAADEVVPAHVRQKRAALRTPLGKRITSTLVAELGKRPKELYSFGIGKRSISAKEMEEFIAEEAANERKVDDQDFTNDKRDPYAFGLGKRSSMSMKQHKRDPYAFGLGKRDPYAFGLGKRDPYAFGLGKRDPYAFGLGKRDPYAFGLGKRDPYAFGLGKRDDEPYAFGLGKRYPYTFGLGKRDPYAFGLGKRDPYSFGLGK